MGETQNITLSIPKKLAREMRLHRRIRWSRVASEAIEKELEREKGLETLEVMDRLLYRSKLTERDAERIGHAIKKEIAKRFAHAADS